jgi:RNA-binding protein YlmH
MSELYARLDDLCDKADKGEVAISTFLTPKELYFADKYLARRGAMYKSFGGYGDAERQRMYIFPEYMGDVPDADEISSFLSEYGFSSEIVSLYIEGSGYRKLTHRDFLGSALGLGVDRDVLGDIVVLEEGGRRALLFCDSAISPFFLSSFEKVASDKVKVREVSVDEIELPARRFSPIQDTVASPRFDCVVSALCSLSRAKAAEIISSGAAELDYECEERCDRNVSEGALISVRGYGKFKVHSISDKTKKGRFRLLADKYI